MSPEIMDLSTYPRQEHFRYFAAMANPYVGTAVETDITDLLSCCHRQGLPFFLTLLYCVGRAANAVPELRQRVIGGQIVQYDHCDTSHTVLHPDGTYAYCRLNCMQPFADYLPTAQSLHEQAKHSGNLDDGEDGDSLLFISTLPWVHYTSLTQPTPTPADSNPRITWGKYVTAGGRTTLPMTLLVNHALVDGMHIGAFYEALEKEMNQFTRKEKGDANGNLGSL